MTAIVETGVINGRFQPFHHGHAEYLLTALRRSKRLVIGITNPHVMPNDGSGPDAHRDLAISNPFTFFHRLEMIRDFMIDMGIDRCRFEIVPFPINDPMALEKYIPRSAVVFFTIYDEWGREKVARLQQNGFKTEILWERPESAKITTGTAVRRAILSGSIWEHLVPAAIYRYIIHNRLDAVIRADTGAL